MEKQIKTYLASTLNDADIELNAMCSKPPTFEGFAERAMNVFFPEVVKYNIEQVNTKNLIPFGFFQNHTYYNTIYYPRALEWKFIFDNFKNVPKEFETALAIIVWYIGKSFEQKEKETEPPENFNDVRETLSNNFVYISDSQIMWLGKQQEFMDAFDIVFKREHDEEGFEKTKSLALKYAIDAKLAKRMLNELKISFNMVDEQQVLDFIFLENDPFEELEKLRNKSEHYLKILFDYVTEENINDLLKENLSEDMYKILCKYKTPESLAEIIKVCPQFYAFAQDNIKEILASDKSKPEVIANLIKYAQKNGRDLQKINSYFDIINKNESTNQFLLDISKLSDIDAVNFLVDQYENYFSEHQNTKSIDPNEALAIHLNLYFNFGGGTAQKVLQSQNVDDLKDKVSKDDGSVNFDYINNLLIELKPEQQKIFIKNLNKKAQQQLKSSFGQCKDFATKMKLAGLASLMKNS